MSKYETITHLAKEKHSLACMRIKILSSNLNVLSGPGKLKIFRQASYVHDESKTEFCVLRKKFPILMKDIVEVVGTFINGTLHGTAKLVLENQFSVIANFNNGIMKGG